MSDNQNQNIDELEVQQNQTTDDQGNQDKKPTEGGMLRKKLEESLAKIRKFEEAERKLKEEEAKKKGDYEELIRLEKERAEKLASENRGLKTAGQLSNLLRKSNLKAEFEDLVLSTAKSQIEYDDSGNPTNLDLVIEEMSNKYPSAFEVKTDNKSKPSTGAVPTNFGTSSKKLSLDEYKKLSLTDRKKAKEDGIAPF
jgi:hypothetical protein